MFAKWALKFLLRWYYGNFRNLSIRIKRLGDGAKDSKDQRFIIHVLDTSGLSIQSKQDSLNDHPALSVFVLSSSLSSINLRAFRRDHSSVFPVFLTASRL